MLNISLDKSEQPIRPSDTLTGICKWQIEPERLSDDFNLQLVWETDGKGDQDSAIVASYPLPKQAQGKQRFELKLPANAPPSYAGQLINIHWFLRLHLKTEKIFGFVPINKDKNKAQIPLNVLAPLEPPTIETTADAEYTALAEEYHQTINDTKVIESMRNMIGRSIKKQMDGLESFRTPALTNSTCTFVLGMENTQATRTLYWLSRFLLIASSVLMLLLVSSMVINIGFTLYNGLNLFPLPPLIVQEYLLLPVGLFFGSLAIGYFLLNSVLKPTLYWLSRFLLIASSVLMLLLVSSMVINIEFTLYNGLNLFPLPPLIVQEYLLLPVGLFFGSLAIGYFLLNSVLKPTLKILPKAQQVIQDKAPKISITPARMRVGHAYQVAEQKPATQQETKLRLEILEQVTYSKGSSTLEDEHVLAQHTLATFPAQQMKTQTRFRLPEQCPPFFKLKNNKITWRYEYAGGHFEPCTEVQYLENVKHHLGSRIGVSFVCVFLGIAALFISGANLWPVYTYGSITQVSQEYAQQVEPFYAQNPDNFPTTFAYDGVKVDIEPQTHVAHFEWDKKWLNSFIDVLPSRWEMSFDPEQRTWHCQPSKTFGVDANLLPIFCR